MEGEEYEKKILYFKIRNNINSISNNNYGYYSRNDDYRNYGTSYNFGSGKENTRKLIDYWNDNPTAGSNGEYYEGSNGEYYDWNYDYDIWPNIQSKYNKGWFVPSKEEWSAFGANLGITSSNYYKTFGLENYYWSSSQCADRSLSAWYAYFYGGCMYYDYVNYNIYVRLATTF